MTAVRNYAAPALELWLTGSERDVSAFSRSPGLNSVLRDSFGWRRVKTLFFDTPDAILAGQGASLELRVTDVGTRQILHLPRKTPIGSSGVFTAPIDGHKPDFAAFAMVSPQAEGPLCALKDAEERLECVNEVESDQWHGVAFRDGDAIETRINIGKPAPRDWAGEGGDAPVADIKLSLLTGGARTLFSFAREAVAHSDGRLRVASRRAAQLASSAGLGNAIGNAPKIEISTGFSAAEVLSVGIAASAWRLIDLTPFLKHGHHPEAARQARVALRRFRVFEKAFRKSVSSNSLRRLAAQARDYARLIGEARDWDVFLAETIPALGVADFDPAGATILTDQADAMRKAAWARVSEAIDTPEYSAFALDLLEAAYVQEWCRSADALSGDAAEFARVALAKGHQGAVEVAGKIDLNNLDTLHDLRLELKKFRYTAQIFRGLYPKVRRKPYFSALAKLQDQLGALNDAVVAQRLAETAFAACQAEDGARAMRAMAYIYGSRKTAADIAARAAVPAWQALDAMEPFWLPSAALAEPSGESA